MPDNLPDDLAIFTEPVAVALHAAWRRHAAAGEKVMVLGCGTIGFLLIQVLRLLQPECEITAVAQFPWQADLAREYGADHVFYAADDGYNKAAQITGASLYVGRGGNRMLLGGFDLVFDVVGIETTLNNALRWTRAGGSVILVGVNLHRMHLDVTPIWYQEVDLLGAVGHDVIEWRGESVSTFELAMRWMQMGQIHCDRMLTHRFPLDAYRQAFAVAVDKQKHQSIKVAFDLARDFASS
ncbi:MAG: zinc-binding dehydrogenase [Anaerolineae bacterium]|nr:zinc-binding dehydrogenase [Anaerolineae bacterium]